MNFLAISGSGRAASTNTALLQIVSQMASPLHHVTVFSQISDLPVFSPDRETEDLPAEVRKFIALVGRCDGILIASPEGSVAKF